VRDWRIDRRFFIGFVVLGDDTIVGDLNDPLNSLGVGEVNPYI